MNDFEEKNIELLISQLKESEDVDLRCSALKKLGENEENYDKAVPAITSALDDDNWLVRVEAANTLRIIGEKALPGLATLKNSILEPRNRAKKGVFHSAINTLEKIQTSGPDTTTSVEVSVAEEPGIESEILPPEETPIEAVEPTEPSTEISQEYEIFEEKEEIAEEIEDFIEDSIEDALEGAVEDVTDKKFDDDVLEDIAEEIAEEITEEITEETHEEPKVELAEEVAEEIIEESTKETMKEVAEDITEETAEDSKESLPESFEETSQITSVEETPDEDKPTETSTEVIEEQEIIEGTPRIEEEEKLQQKDFTTRKMSKTIMKVILVGEGPVGKTSLRRKFVGDDLTHEYNEVFGADITSKQLDINEEGFVFQFWDVATGDHSYFSSEIFFRGVNGVLLVYDISQRESFVNIKNLITEIIKLEGKELIFVLVGNKIDLRENQEIECVSTPDGVNLAKTLSLVFGINIPFFETSAISGVGVDDMFKTFIDEITSQYFKMRED